MAIPAKKMVWVTANRSFVGGPEVGFTLLEDHCYQIREDLARNFIAEKWATAGKERRKRKVMK